MSHTQVCHRPLANRGGAGARTFEICLAEPTAHAACFSRAVWAADGFGAPTMVVRCEQSPDTPNKLRLLLSSNTCNLYSFSFTGGFWLHWNLPTSKHPLKQKKETNYFCEPNNSTLCWIFVLVCTNTIAFTLTHCIWISDGRGVAFHLYDEGRPSIFLPAGEQNLNSCVRWTIVKNFEDCRMQFTCVKFVGTLQSKFLLVPCALKRHPAANSA